MKGLRLVSGYILFKMDAKYPEAKRNRITVVPESTIFAGLPPLPGTAAGRNQTLRGLDW